VLIALDLLARSYTAAKPLKNPCIYQGADKIENVTDLKEPRRPA
jgi:hypothetical protein